MSLVTPQNVKGFEKQMYEHNLAKNDIFSYPLIDHDKAYVHNRNRFIVSYGYQNNRSEEQLKMLQEALDKVGKRHHLRVLRTRGKLDESKWGPNSVMIKTIISVRELDDDTWSRLEHYVFDERYDGGVI